MRKYGSARFVVVGGTLLAVFAVLDWAEGRAQAPGGRDLKTVRGTVKEYTTAKKGERDGVVLADGTWVHWPPHLQDRFSDLAARGERIQATGWWETDKKGYTKFEVSTLTNLRTNSTRTNDDQDREPKAKGKKGKKGKKGPIWGESRTVRGTVKEFTTAPKGEVDGFLLNDGLWVHWPPHLQDRFKSIVARGDRVLVVGRMATGKKGDTKFEVATLTNLAENVTRTNPELAVEPGLGQAGRQENVEQRGENVDGRRGNVEDRLRAMEERLDQLMRQLDRLQRKK